MIWGRRQAAFGSLFLLSLLPMEAESTRWLYTSKHKLGNGAMLWIVTDKRFGDLWHMYSSVTLDKLQGHNDFCYRPNCWWSSKRSVELDYLYLPGPEGWMEGIPDLGIGMGREPLQDVARDKLGGSGIHRAGKPL